MAEKQRKNKALHWLGRLVGLLLALFLIAAVYLAAILLKTDDGDASDSWIVEEEAEPITRMQAANMSDVPGLAQLFGAPLPALPGLAPAGEGRNVSHDGQLVRQVTLRYDGFIITAVRPASAAPLLLRPDLSVSLRSDVTVMNLPAVLASRDAAYCAYFSTDSAAYSLYAPATTEDDFFALLSHITSMQ